MMVKNEVAMKEKIGRTKNGENLKNQRNTQRTIIGKKQLEGSTR